MADITTEQALKVLRKAERGAEVTEYLESEYGLVLVIPSEGDPLDPNQINPDLGVRFVTNDLVLVYLNPSDPVHAGILDAATPLGSQRVR